MTLVGHTRSGFTLIELAIAMMILLILGAVAIPRFMAYLEKAKVSATKTNLQALKSAIDGFKIDTGKYPPKLRDLIEKPKDETLARRWQKGGYLEGTDEIPKDGWDEDFVYKITPQGKNPYDLYSYGPDGAGSPKDEWISVWDKR